MRLSARSYQRALAASNLSISRTFCNAFEFINGPSSVNSPQQAKYSANSCFIKTLTTCNHRRRARMQAHSNPFAPLAALHSDVAFQTALSFKLFRSFLPIGCRLEMQSGARAAVFWLDRRLPNTADGTRSIQKTAETPRECPSWFPDVEISETLAARMRFLAEPRDQFRHCGSCRSMISTPSGTSKTNREAGSARFVFMSSKKISV